MKINFKKTFYQICSLITVFALSANSLVPALSIASSGVVYASTNTSNPTVNLDQCANGKFSSPDQCTGNAWVNGNVNDQKAHYREGDTLPYRFIMTNLSLGAHTLTFEWDTTKNGKHALDYLTTYNRTETNADPCSNVSGCNKSIYSTYPIAVDPNSNPITGVQTPGNYTLFNGTITDVSNYSLSGSYADTSSTRVTVTFTANTSTVVLAVGGHIASQLNWGVGNSASSISGSPYHMSVIDLDGSGGNQDRSLAAAAILLPPSLSTQVSSSSIYLGQSVTDTATLSGSNGAVAGSINFYVCGPNTTAAECYPGGTQVGSSVPVTSNKAISSSFTPTQTGFYCFRAEYTPDSSAAYSPIYHTNNTTECFNVTQTNSITIVKDAQPNDPQDFSFYTNGTGLNSFSLDDDNDPTLSNSQTFTGLLPGNYSITENLTLGWKLDNINCTLNGQPTGVVNSNQATLSLTTGNNVTCTFTNLRLPKLTVTKIVNNNYGGTKVVSDFPLYVEDTSVISGQQNIFQPGTYIVREVNQSGYSSTISGSCDSNGNVILNYGDEKTCTITNNDIAPRLIVIKNVNNDNGGTKVASDFTMRVTGANVSQSSFTGSSSGTTVTLNAGSYRVDEDNALGYTKLLSADCSGTINIGETKICTIINDDQQGTLIVKKVVTNNNGGNKSAGYFSFSVNGGSNINFETDGQNELTVNSGIYTVIEPTVTGYSTSYNNCSNVFVPNGGSATCTITNDDISPTITLIKVVDNNFGDNAKPSDFGLKIDNVVVPQNIKINVSANTAHIIDENQISGYEFVSITGSDKCPTLLGGAVTLSEGEEITCTIANQDQPAEITGMKFEDRNGNGIKDSDDSGLAGWTIYLDANSNNSLDSGEVSTTTGIGGFYSFEGLNAGMYKVREVNQPGWTQTTTNPSDIVLSNGQEKENVNFGNFKNITISGEKFNDLNGDHTLDSGEPGLANWSIVLDKVNDSNPPSCSGGVIAGETCVKQTNNSGNYSFSNLGPGLYIVSEVFQTGWEQTSPNADYGGQGHQSNGTYLLNVVSGSNINERDFGNRGSLSITACKYEDSNGTDEGGAHTNVNNWQFRLNGSAIQNTGETNCTTFSHLSPGTYTVDELPLPSDWFVADGSNGVKTLTLVDQNLTANFYNYRKGLITVNKVTDPSGSDQEFYFTLSGKEEITGKASNKHALVFNYLEPGKYNLSELKLDGWYFTNAICNGTEFNNGGEIIIASGSQVNCTFYNTQKGSVQAIKYHDLNGDGQRQETEPALSNWLISLENGDSIAKLQTDNNGLINYSDLLPGIYTLKEEMQEGWQQINISCNDQQGEELQTGYKDSSYTLQLRPGQNIQCLVANKFIAPKLIITKANNKQGLDLFPGDNVLYTIILEAQDGRVINARVVDLLPSGFNYRIGSWKIISSIRGDLKNLITLTEPKYIQMGIWNLGDIADGEKITLSYIADISQNQAAGSYKDIAWADGKSIIGQRVLAAADVPGKLNQYFVGTDVKVISNVLGISYNGEQEVLGITYLPATGSQLSWLILQLALIISGSLLIFLSIKLRGENG